MNMNMEKPYTYDIKTVLKVDQRFETVRQMLSTMVNEDNYAAANRNKKARKNSFSFGWVNSFSITNIKVKLVKDSDYSTTIFVEAKQPEGNEPKRVLHNGFYDFVQYLKKKFTTVTPANNEYSIRGEQLGVWATLFIILLTLFLSWYYLFGNWY